LPCQFGSGNSEFFQFPGKVFARMYRGACHALPPSGNRQFRHLSARTRHRATQSRFAIGR
jgi:hypothetical protein